MLPLTGAFLVPPGERVTQPEGVLGFGFQHKEEDSPLTLELARLHFPFGSAGTLAICGRPVLPTLLTACSPIAHLLISPHSCSLLPSGHICLNKHLL